MRRIAAATTFMHLVGCLAKTSAHEVVAVTFRILKRRIHPRVIFFFKSGNGNKKESDRCCRAWGSIAPKQWSLSLLCIIIFLSSLGFVIKQESKKQPKTEPAASAEPMKRPEVLTCCAILPGWEYRIPCIIGDRNRSAHQVSFFGYYQSETFRLWLGQTVLRDIGQEEYLLLPGLRQVFRRTRQTYPRLHAFGRKEPPCICQSSDWEILLPPWSVVGMSH